MKHYFEAEIEDYMGVRRIYGVVAESREIALKWASKYGTVVRLKDLYESDWEEGVYYGFGC